MKNFLSNEQKIYLTNEECKQIISEYEPSVVCRKNQMMSAKGFSHFMVFSEMHDIFDHSKIDTVFQVHTLLFTIYDFYYSVAQWVLSKYQKKYNFRGNFCEFFFRTWLVLYHIILLQLHIIRIWWEIKLLQTPVLMVIFEH